ncbi:MAG TPA: SRPBCC domain-containing protein [Acidimicrobiales bacterium]|nr:SRPBCC domain-containing protein [Acidimicrobiales bacterium]
MSDDTPYGTTEELADGRWQLRFRRTYPHAVEKVWRAVTEPEHLAAWFPTSIDGSDRAREQMSRWVEVHPRYVERFGPEASTIGPPQSG